MIKYVYVIATTTHYYDLKKDLEFKISQECYSSLSMAQRFCESRENVYQIDTLHYCSEPESFNGWYQYQILELTLV